MFAADALPSTLPAEDAAARALHERQMAILTRLAEIGMEIAEATARQAASGDAGAAMPDPALAYARVARAVRLTLALQSRLAHDLAAGAQAAAKARRAEAGRRRDRIHARLERVFEAEAADAEAAEALSSAAWERLSETDDADILDCPFAEAVALICRDLGLPPDWAPAFPSPSLGEGPGLGVFAPPSPRMAGAPLPLAHPARAPRHARARARAP